MGARIEEIYGQSQELGVSEWSLRRWIKLHVGPGLAKGQGQETVLELEKAKLRRELETVSRQRDILKRH